MRTQVDILVDLVMPEVSAVLRSQAIPEDAGPQPRTMDLVHDALAVYRRLAHPAGLVMEVTRDDFAAIYQGEGKNEVETPLGLVYPRAQALGVFAVTIGAEVCEEIARLFEVGEFALGSMLDSVASEGAEMAAEVAQSEFRGHLGGRGSVGSASGVLRFSPGYCGWHLSGQRALFALLQPETIGITLNASCLMTPLKSVSGVIVAAAMESLLFVDDFPFCGVCDTHSCRERLPEAVGS
jgi:hypothetical protein